MMRACYRARHPCPAPTVASRCPPADCSPAALLAESDTAGRACLVARPGVTVSEELPAANRPAGQAVDSGGYGTGHAAGSSARMPHAWAYPKGATAHIGMLYKRFLFYVDCGAPIRRERYFVMCLLPTLLCLLPWIVFLLCPADAKALASLCWGCAIMCAVGPCPDYMGALYAWRQVPRGGYLQEGEDGGDYWYLL